MRKRKDGEWNFYMWAAGKSVGWARGKDKRAGSLVYFSFDDIPLLLAGWACNQWSFSSIFGLFLKHFFFMSCVYYCSYPFVLS